MYRALRIGLRAPNEYGLFLALGSAALIAFEMLLISGGVLGAIPLSGVVSPFLSFGNTAMLANFLIFGILLAISNHSRTGNMDEPFRKPVHNLDARMGAVRGRAALHGGVLPGRTRSASIWRATPMSSKTTASSVRSAIRG